MRHAVRWCLVVAMGAALSAVATQAAQVEIQLPADATASAGVFTADGRLLRTLWSGRALRRGPVRVDWDGLDDDGQPVAKELDLRVRLLSHRLRYEWQGVIGNTSDAAGGGSVHRAYGPIHDMAIDAAGNAFYVVGYNEQQHALHRFAVHQPGTRTPLAFADPRSVFRHVATDGKLVYFANAGLAAPRGSSFRGEETFVVAFTVNDGAPHRFSAGKTVAREPRWSSVIDLETHGNDVRERFPDAPSGIAVQRAGNVLFVAHRGRNEIRMFDKHSGGALGSIRVDDPGELAVSPDDSLWVVCREGNVPTALRFRRQGADWIQVARLTDPPALPVSLDVSPRDGVVAIVDAATEQMHFHDPQGQLLQRLGRPGGYRSGGPEVTDDRFWFSAGPAYVAFQSDGTFWVGDPGNRRNLQFAGDGRKIGQIMYLPHTYVVSIDPARPQRVFAQFLEFEVDYTKPLRQSWKLVRNWAAASLPRALNTGATGLRRVVTLPNGRTYGVVLNNEGGGDEFVELSASGLRPTGVRLGTQEYLHADGSRRTHLIRGETLAVHTRELQSFEAGAVPAWSPPRLLASASARVDRDPHYHDVPVIHGINDPAWPQTASGLVVAFNPGRSRGFHLGAMRPGETGWWWRASPAGSWDVNAQGAVLSSDGRYELGRGVHYPGNTVVTAAESIIYGYHGEAWNGGQANQWLHFHESGLFLGQFGEPVYAYGNREGARPGAAGNAFSPGLVAVGNELYLWHNDESVHGGVHRWRIAGRDTLRMIEVPIRSDEPGG